MHITLKIVVIMIFSTKSLFAAATLTIGDPQNPSSLPTLINNAYTTGARDITIQPGLYAVAGSKGEPIFHLKSWTDATIHAAGVTVIADFTTGGRSLFELDHCNQVTVEGATLSQTAMSAYQGRVIATGQDEKNNATCDWKPDAGYPVPPADAKVFPFGPNVVDAATRLLKLDNGDYGGLPMRPLGDGSYRISFNQPKLKFQIGDWLVGRFGDPNGKAPFKVHLVDSRDCTTKDITMTRNGFGAIREEGGGGNHIIHCIWTTGPRPTGATEDSIVTDAADGFHSTGANPGPDIEGCIMSGVFLDDCFAIHGGFQDISAVAGNTLTLGKGWAELRIGEPARICSDHGFIAQANVTAIVHQADHSTLVTLDKPVTAPSGSKVNNPLSCGPGFKIIGCMLGNVRSRGILIKADNGLIKDNVIDGCVMSAVSVGPEYYWNEAGYVENLKIEGNIFRNNGKRFADPVVLIHGEGVQANRHIVIDRNQFLFNFSTCMSINWAVDVAMSENIITAPPTALGGTIAPPIVLENCQDIVLKKNRIDPNAAFKLPLVKSGANTANLSGDAF